MSSPALHRSLLDNSPGLRSPAGILLLLLAPVSRVQYSELSIHVTSTPYVTICAHVFRA